MAIQNLNQTEIEAVSGGVAIDLGASLGLTVTALLGGLLCCAVPAVGIFLHKVVGAVSGLLGGLLGCIGCNHTA